MRKVRLLVAAVTMAISSLILVSPPAQACYGDVCDGMYQLCNTLADHGVKWIPRDCVR